VVEIEALFDGVDFSETLTRARFEEINNDLFKNTLGPVKQVLEDSGLKKNQIDEIVLVGGSTRIPKVPQLIKDYDLDVFEKTLTDTTIHANGLSREVVRPPFGRRAYFCSPLYFDHFSLICQTGN
jgi:molecular chaperone DnaK (HSP70)